MRYLLILLFITSHAFADDFEITLAGNFETDSTYREEEFLFKLDQQDDKERYHNKFSIEVENGYIRSNGTETKNQELFDYEHEVKMFFANKKHFMGGYWRYKEDKFQTIAGSNYTIYTAGLGYQHKKEKETFSVSLFLGQRHNSIEDIFITKPSVSYQNYYKKLRYTLESTLIKGHNFEIFDNKIELAYPLSEAISLKYLFEYERTKDASENDFDRRNKIALSFKF